MVPRCHPFFHNRLGSRGLTARNGMRVVSCFQVNKLESTNLGALMAELGQSMPEPNWEKSRHKVKPPCSLKCTVRTRFRVVVLSESKSQTHHKGLMTQVSTVLVCRSPQDRVFGRRRRLYNCLGLVVEGLWVDVGVGGQEFARLIRHIFSLVLVQTCWIQGEISCPRHVALHKCQAS